MKKTFFLGKTFFFLVLFLIPGLFTANFCFAKLNDPTNVHVVLPVGEGSAKVAWEWAGPSSNPDCSVCGPICGSTNCGTNNRFVLSYRIFGTQNEWSKRYPSASVREYTIMGLVENTTYEWTIMAEAVNPADNSAEAPGDNFTTSSGGGNGNGNGNGNGGGGSPIDLTNPLKAETLQEALDSLINFLFFLAMVLAPILIIYAGFLILTAGGDARKISRGRQVIMWTLVAVAIVLFAKGLPAVIKGAFGG